MSNVTRLYLLNVPLESDYKHTLYFDSPENQEKYFKSKAVGSELKYDEFSYQRKDEKIRIPKQFDELNGRVNYVMYQNTAYNDKWFYAFIIDIKYISDGVTEVYIKTDVMQTWYFDYTLKSCFVEREHTKNDKVGANTLPEGLETGEYICNKVIHDRSTQNTVFIVASSVNLSNGADTGLKIYNNVVNGWRYYYFNTKESIEDKIENLAELRTNDAIVSIFVMPSIFVDKGADGYVIQNYVPSTCYWSDLGEGNGSNELIYKPNTVNGYLPHNKKLLTYPYSYLLMDNNAGSTAVYHYELFDYGVSNPDLCDFKLVGAITPGGSIKLIPMYYDGVGENDHHSLTGGKFPVCGWQSDYYTNWLTQNSLNLEVQAESIEIVRNQEMVNSYGGSLQSAGSLQVFSALTQFANAGFAAEKYYNQIKGITAQKQMHEFQSPTVRGNINSGDVNYVDGKIRFSAYQMSIKEEYARIIDGYFSMYGYQTNRVKVPNYNHRERYWYTKTVGCELDGAIPNSDIELIKGCYNNGITFWVNPNEIGKYTDDEGELIHNIIIEEG